MRHLGDGGSQLLPGEQGGGGGHRGQAGGGSLQGGRRGSGDRWRRRGRRGQGRFGLSRCSREGGLRTAFGGCSLRPEVETAGGRMGVSGGQWRGPGQVGVPLLGRSGHGGPACLPQKPRVPVSPSRPQCQSGRAEREPCPPVLSSGFWLSPSTPSCPNLHPYASLQGGAGGQQALAPWSPPLQKLL